MPNKYLKKLLDKKEMHYRGYLSEEDYIKEVNKILEDFAHDYDRKHKGAMSELEQIIEYITADKKVKYKATILFDCDIIKDELQRLDFLDEAMDLPTNCHSIFKNRNDDEVAIMRKEEYDKYCNQDKVLKIVKERQVDIYHLNKSETVEEYNEIWDGAKYCLTKEEFDLLKEWFK